MINLFSNAYPMKRNAQIILLLANIFAAQTAVGLADDRAAANSKSARLPTEGESGPGGTTKLEYDLPTWSEAPDTGALLLRLVSGTGTVLVLCVVTLLAGRRWLRGPAPRIAEGSQLQILETVALGNRCCVHLLRAGQHQIVVGTDGTGMKSLVALPESFEKSLAAAEDEESESATNATRPLVAVGA